MSKLFITSRELDLISDLSKELIKDIVGQKVYYYRVREDLTDIHDVYEEATKKIFDPPIEIEARVNYQPEEIRTNRFGNEEMSSIEVFFHERDLLDRKIEVRVGDYFSYGDIFFEITSSIVEANVYGQIEHAVGTKIVGKQARKGQIDFAAIGPTYSGDEDTPDAVQEEFVQQRGQEENSEGETGDSRDLQKKGKLDPPISEPAEVKKQKTSTGTTESYFYDEN